MPAHNQQITDHILLFIHSLGARTSRSFCVEARSEEAGISIQKGAKSDERSLAAIIISPLHL
jgi:hypothetical protein